MFVVGPPDWEVSSDVLSVVLLLLLLLLVKFAMVVF